jgi:glycerate kinase
MATYVNDLRLKEIATGDESGTWGTSTNTNLELIGEAFGSGSEALSDASTATITMADGTSDAARAMALTLTGSLSQACTVTLAPNTVNKCWIIQNSAGDTVTISRDEYNELKKANPLARVQDKVEVFINGQRYNLS